MKITVQAVVMDDSTVALECSQCNILGCCGSEESSALMKKHLEWHGATNIQE